MASDSLILAGDLYLNSGVLTHFKKRGPGYFFKHLKDYRNCSYFVNLEAPVTLYGEDYPSKEWILTTPPETLSVLTDNNIKGVGLANNHIMDKGAVGLINTLFYLNKRDIKYTGAGLNTGEALEPLVLTLNGKKVGFTAFSNTFPLDFYAKKNKPGTLRGTRDNIKEAAEATTGVSDVQVASFHWSEQLSTETKPYQRKLAHYAVDRGYDIVIGHHPHCIQGVEYYKDAFIFYSLGNFIFDSYSKKFDDSILVKLEIEKNKFSDPAVIPINVSNREVFFAPRPLDSSELEDFLEKLTGLSERWNTKFEISGKTIKPVVKRSSKAD